MIKRLVCLWLLVSIALLGCQPAGVSDELLEPQPGPTISLQPEPEFSPTQTIPPSPTSSPPTALPTARPYRPVVVLSFDGAPDGLVNGWMQAGNLPNFASLAADGVQAEYALSVDPSLTAPAQSSLASGAWPAVTGMVSNEYHLAADNFYWYRQGFDEPLDDGEPLWVAASRQGYTTAALFFPGATPQIPAQLADYTISYGEWLAYSRQETLALTPAQSWIGAPLSYSQPLECEYQIPKIARLYFLAVDSQDDQVANYDQVYINLRREVTPVMSSQMIGEWTPIEIRPATDAGAWFTVQTLDPENITFYHTTVYQNMAAPRPLLEELNRRFGFYPAGGDLYAIQHNWISAEENLLLIERNTRWTAEVTAWVLEAYRPELVFAWQEAFDTAGHAYFLSDPRQPDYTPDHAEEYQNYYLRAAQAADDALGLILGALDLGQATVLVASDHGMSPVHTAVYVNTVLEEAGLLTLDEKAYVVIPETQALAVASGAAVHIYINLEGRERAGIVAPDEYVALQAQIIDLFRTLVDPQTGEPVFERVIPQADLTELNLNHPFAGDVFAQAAPGYTLDDWRGWRSTFAPARLYGQHGYNRTFGDMQAILLAIGDRVVGIGEVIPPVDLVDIAPTIAGWLGIELQGATGQPIPELGYP